MCIRVNLGKIQEAFFKTNKITKFTVFVRVGGKFHPGKEFMSKENFFSSRDEF